MHKSDFLTFQSTGVYVPGKKIPIKANHRRNGSSNTTPSFARKGYDLFNNDQLSRELLTKIRAGINAFMANMERISNSSVMGKYYYEMVDSDRPLWYDRYSEQMVPAVYQTIIAHNKRAVSQNDICPYLGRAFVVAGELCWDWMCSFYREDSERTPVSNVAPDFFHDDYHSRGKRVRVDYWKLMTEINAGFDLFHDLQGMNDLYITSKNKSLESNSIFTMSSIIDGSQKPPVATVDLNPAVQMDHFKYLDPTVEAVIENSYTEENAKMSHKAKGRLAAQQIASNVKVHSDDQGMEHIIDMQQATHNPIIKNTPVEESTMYNNNAPMAVGFGATHHPVQQPVAPVQQATTVALINHLGQPILTSNGQPIGIPPATLQGMQQAGSITIQLDPYNNPCFDSQGFPFVVIHTPTGQAQFVDLTGSQSQEFQARFEQPQQNQIQPQAAVTAQPANAGSVDMSIPGMEVLEQLSVTPQSTPTSSVAAAGIAELTGFTATTGMEAEVITPTQKEEPVKTEKKELKMFDLVLPDGTYSAILDSDQEYVGKSTVKLNMIVNERDYLLGYVYLPEGDFEILLNKERFMNREAHLGYVLDPSQGERTAKEVHSQVIDQVAQTTASSADLTVTLDKDNVVVLGGLEELTEMMTENFNYEEKSKFTVNMFEIMKTLPGAKVKKTDALVDALNLETDMEQLPSCLSKLTQLVLALREQGATSAATNVMRTFDFWMIDALTNRLGYEQGTFGKMADLLTSIADVNAYLEETNKLVELYTMFNEEFDTFFNYNMVSFRDESDEVGEELELDSEDTDKDEDEGMTYFLAQDIVGHAVHVPSLTSNQTSGAIDPSQNYHLWALLKLAFAELPGKAEDVKYLWITNDNGTIVLAQSIDTDLGIMRIVETFKLI